MIHSTRSFLFWFRIGVVVTFLFTLPLGWSLCGAWRAAYRGLGQPAHVIIDDLNHGNAPPSSHVKLSNVESALGDQNPTDAFFQKTHLIPLRQNGSTTTALTTRVFLRVRNSNDYEKAFNHIDQDAVSGYLYPLQKNARRVLTDSYPDQDWSNAQEVVIGMSSAKDRLVGTTLMMGTLAMGLAVVVAMYLSHLRLQKKWTDKIRPSYNFQAYPLATQLASNTTIPLRKTKRDAFAMTDGPPITLPSWRYMVPSFAYHWSLYAIMIGGSQWIHGEGWFVLLIGTGVLPFAFKASTKLPGPVIAKLLTKPPLLLEAKQLYHDSILRSLGFNCVGYFRSVGVFVGAVYLSRHGNVMIQIGSRNCKRAFSISSFLSDKTVLQSNSQTMFRGTKTIVSGKVNLLKGVDELIQSIEMHEQTLHEYLSKHDVLECELTADNFYDAIDTISDFDPAHSI